MHLKELGLGILAHECPAKQDHRAHGGRLRSRRNRQAEFFRIPSEIRDDYPICCGVIETCLDRYRRRFHRLAKWHTFWHRFVGGLQISTSATLPVLLSVLDTTDPVARAALTGISILVGAWATFATFYGWENKHEFYRSKEVALEMLISSWVLEMYGVRHISQGERVAAALSVTRDAILRAEEIFTEKPVEEVTASEAVNGLLARQTRPEPATVE